MVLGIGKKKSVIFETQDILYRYFYKQDIPRLVELISSSPEAMPLFFHSIDAKARLKIFMLRFIYEKYVDRLKRFVMSLSPYVLFTSVYDRTIIVAVDKKNGKVIGAVFLSPLLDSWSLDIIIVDKPYRRRGIGSTLLELAKKHVKNLGASYLFTSTSLNSTQAEFFRKRGFVIRYVLNEMQCKL
ncbi:MAG: GNAT family N-acetyltransferase [Thermoproteota archaeon]